MFTTPLLLLLLLKTNYKITDSLAFQNELFNGPIFQGLEMMKGDDRSIHSCSFVVKVDYSIILTSVWMTDVHYTNGWTKYACLPNSHNEFLHCTDQAAVKFRVETVNMPQPQLCQHFVICFEISIWQNNEYTCGKKRFKLIRLTYGLALIFI